MTTATGLRRTPQQARARQTADRVLCGLANLLGIHPLQDITMSMIADEIGISKAAIYRYYPDKPSVVRALAGCYTGPLADAIVRHGDDPDAAEATYIRHITDDVVLRAIWITGYTYADLGAYLADFERQVAERLTDHHARRRLWRQWLRNARGLAELQILDAAALEKAA